VRKIENLRTQEDRPVKDVVIADCGQLTGDAALAADVKAPDALGDPYEDFPDDCAAPPTSAKELIAIAEACKGYGTTAFKAGNHTIAIDKYQKALRYLNEDLDQDTDEAGAAETEKTLAALRFALNNNMALANMKLGAWGEVVACADAALAVDGIGASERAKALYRRGKAGVELRDLDRAAEDLKEAHQLVPGDAVVAAEHAAVKKKLAKADASQRAAVKKFFS
jgi:peptidyl-prolyl isomerase D